MSGKLASLIGLARFLYLQRVTGFSPPGDEPFMDAAGVARFRLELGRASHYVEFGSGGSTVMADRAGLPTVSVENDRFYARAVASRLGSATVRQIVVPMGLTREWGWPLRPSQRAAQAYVTAPWDQPWFPDFILVDGRYRVACALESARRAHAAGTTATLMFDDYAERPQYHVVEDHLGPPEMAGRAALFRIGLGPVPEAAVTPWLDVPA